MKIKTRRVLVAASLFTGIATFAQASTVTFAPLTSLGIGYAGDGTTYLEGGFTFTSSTVDPSALAHWGTSNAENADPTGATLFQNVADADLVVTRTGGGAFYLQSFDLADVFNNGTNSVIPFSYTDGAGIHSSSLTLDNAVGLQTFSFGYAGVTSFSLTQVDPYFQIDNIVFDQVPEPETYALMSAGLGLMGFIALRRKQKAACKRGPSCVHPVRMFI